MAGAYTALVSLTNTIDQIENDPRNYFSLFEVSQIGSLQRNARLFLEFVESYDSHGRSKEVEDLEMEIASAARLAQDLLESRLADLALGECTVGLKNWRREFLKLVEKLDSDYGVVRSNFSKRRKVDSGYRQWSSNSAMLAIRFSSIMERVEKLREESRAEDEQPADFMAASSSRALKTANSTMVGFEGYLNQLMDFLTGQKSARQIISIVGMGGIGKTTLSRNAYEHMVIVQHFDIRAWSTISQKYNIKEILLELLSRRGESTVETVDDLGEQLHKKLWGRRYLIVLDDVWSSEVWDRIRFFFPDDGNSSRIVVTSRLSYVASYLGSSSLVMDLLDKDRSWKLFCARTFGEDEEDSPSLDLIEIRKKIVEQCKGLPLSIVVIAGHLRKCLRSNKQWADVAQNIMSYLDSDEDPCLSILSLSYSHLPSHLKPCFLYMGTFPENKEILIPTLIRFWIAEGFLRCKRPLNLEKTAEGYLKDLVDRNLVSVEKQGRNGKLLTFHVHDLLRELCLRVAEKEKFLCVLKHPAVASRCNVGCRICNDESVIIDKSKLFRIVPKAEQVLNEAEFNPDCLATMFRHANTRYMYCDLHWDRSLKKNLQQVTISQIRGRLPYVRLPSSISLLWNLQTLVIHGIFVKILAPVEIWEMPQLRHVDVFDLISLPAPVNRIDFIKMQNLQTLLVVENFKLFDNVCRRIPNIRELEICYNVKEDYYVQNLGRFLKLKSLRLEYGEESDWRYYVLKMTFPDLLKELWLGSSGLHWKDLSMIGLLPNLEMLTLTCVNSVEGRKWDPIEGEFLRLKCLKIYNCRALVFWNAERCHFPILETLTLGYAVKLAEFPSKFGEIPTLGRVYLDRCSVPAAISAMRMLAEQEELGNEDLRLEIQCKDKEELERIMETVKEEGPERKNLHLKYYRFK